MIVTFLGTGTSQGVPMIGCQCEVCRSLDFRDKRLRTSAHVLADGLSLVIDTGPDFRQQMLTSRIVRLNAALFTHEHKDHTAGLDDIRAFNYIQKEQLPIYADGRTLARLRSDFDYAFDNLYPGVPQIDFRVFENEPFMIDGTKIIPVRVMHHKMPIYGFRINDFTYITDAKSIEDGEIAKIKGTKVLALNALRIEKHISHFSLEEALQMIERIGPEKAYLTHISHRLGLHKEVESRLPENVFLAYDGLKLEI